MTKKKSFIFVIHQNLLYTRKVTYHNKNKAKI